MLTEHFTWAEANPRAQDLESEISYNIEGTAHRMEAIRAMLGNGPIIIHSWWRSPDHNRRVGGSSTSDHVNGLAVDFHRKGWDVATTYRFLAHHVRQGSLEVDQLIKYETHIHVGFGARMRNQCWAEQ